MEIIYSYYFAPTDPISLGSFFKKYIVTTSEFISLWVLPFFMQWNRSLIFPTTLNLVLIYIYILKMDKEFICSGKDIFLLLAKHYEIFIMHFLFMLLFTYTWNVCFWFLIKPLSTLILKNIFHLEMLIFKRKWMLELVVLPNMFLQTPIEIKNN